MNISEHTKMIFPLLLIVSVLPLLSSGSVMDLAELYSVQYAVNIAKDPVLENTQQVITTPQDLSPEGPKI